MYNCFYNGPAKTLHNQPDLIHLLNETCPFYINKTDPENSKVCCDSAQVGTLNDQIKVAKGLFQRCPACYNNFLRHFCMITCDPNMSLWFDIPDGDLDNSTGHAYVKSVDVYITPNYADTLYDSCDNVQYPENNDRVIDIMCGGVDTCSPSAWLNFLGDPTANAGQAPFLMKYMINETVPGHPEIKPDNHTFIPCNISDPSLRCSCADCPSPNICPPLPQVVTSHFNYKLTAGLIGGIGAGISVIVCIVALVAAIITYHATKGYRPISGESEPQTNYGTMNGGVAGHTKDSKETDGDSPSSSVGSINADELDLSDRPKGNCGCCQWYVNFGHYFEYRIKWAFYHWGRFCAEYWYLVLFFAILIAAALSCGMFFFKITTNTVELWSAPTSRARIEKNYFDEHFGPFYRTEQLIITAPGLTGYPFQPPEIPATWHFGPVMNMEVLEEVCLSVQGSLLVEPLM